MFPTVFPPTPRSTGTVSQWKSVPRPQGKGFPRLPRTEIDLFKGFPTLGRGAEGAQGGGRGGRNHRSPLPGREKNSSATSDRWKIRGSALPERGVGDASIDLRLFTKSDSQSWEALIRTRL
jgi:hypothetical protein